MKSQRQLNLLTVLLIVYLFWWLTTPYYSNRFSDLATNGFEKILVGCLIILALSYGRLDNIYQNVALLVLGLFGLMLLCDMASSYPECKPAIYWRDTYWKKIVFFAIVAVGLKYPDDIHRVFRWLAYIIFFYQLYSWFDFLRGGSYVHQQGMKRMVGTWSRHTIGSANGFGSLGVYALPFILYWYRTCKENTSKYIAIFAAFVSVMCVVFSGTRAAMVVAVIYPVVVFRTFLLKWQLLATALLLAVCLIPLLPEDIKHRYWNQMLSVSDETLSKTDELAVSSGEGRLKGMINGFKLAVRKPFFGYGPATSGYAVRDVLDPNAKNMQLHNLYGQMVSELGFAAMVVWCFLIGSSIVSSRKLKHMFNQPTRLCHLADAIAGALFVMLVYGLFSHNLYSERWLFLFGSVVAIQSMDWQDYHNQKDVDLCEQEPDEEIL